MVERFELYVGGLVARVVGRTVLQEVDNWPFADIGRVRATAQICNQISRGPRRSRWGRRWGRRADLDLAYVRL